MAKGKVVFTGAEKEWLDYYEASEDTIAINALPDIKTLPWPDLCFAEDSDEQFRKHDSVNVFKNSVFGHS